MPFTQKFLQSRKFSKCATLSGKVLVVDSELEEYKVFLAYKISNNINQIAKSINTDRKSGVVSQLTYDLAIKELQFLHESLCDLLAPAKAGQQVC